MAASYFAPTDVSEALDFLASRSALVVAGGTDVYPALQGQSYLGDILDVTRIDGMCGIARTVEGGYRIGAATTWSDIVHAELPPAFAALQAAAREVGSVQIQNAGTIGGNICNASPAADGVPPLLILDAEVEVTSQSGIRRAGLDTFLLGARQTALQPGEVMTALCIPALPHGACSAFEKLGARRYLVISIAMTAALVVLDGDGWIAEARVAVGACSAVSTRLPALEDALVGQCPGEITVDAAHLAALSPLSDVRGDAAYRTEAVGEQIRRALEGACRE
jgi:CO/xanthine dehydrogenase FAD-binding subunit